MWKVGREDYVFDFGPPIGKLPSYRYLIEDVEKGVRITKIGEASRGQPDRYRYVGPQLSFEFAASRLDLEGRWLDEYEVYLGVVLPKGLSVTTGREIARNIREAFLAWPPDPRLHPNASPVKSVRFSMVYWDQYTPEMKGRFP
jgi:hypothetical protein